MGKIIDRNNEGNSLDNYRNQYSNNVAYLVKELNSLAADNIATEEKLNQLRISNVAFLGALRKKQEEELLKATLAANDQIFKQKTALQLEALELEEEERISALEREHGALSDAKKKEIKAEFALRKKNIEAQAAWEKKNKEKEIKQDAAKAKQNAIKKSNDYRQEQMGDLFGSGKSIVDRAAAFQNIFTGAGKLNDDGTISSSKGASLLSGLSAITGALSNFAKQLETQMDDIASKKSAIDTRLQGSSNEKRLGSYWDQMTADITGIAGVSPLIKQSSLANRVSEMVGQGIAFNVEQRAVLQEVSSKIATTFNAANGTLLRLVRIQQQDTTAGRLGMESALNAFLNNMYETTEYMQSLATSVKSNLEEAMSLMTGENALSFEYQIQKWLGSLSSVGMSDAAIQGLSGVLGQVAAGKLDGITNGGQGNLVIMAANNAGLNISDILSNGLDQTTTNTLMNSMVDYLAKIYNESGNSRVIQQQIASVYGLSASDLKAAVNLSKSSNTIARDGLDYNSAMARLNSMAGSMGSRTSLGEQLSTMWDNVKYSMSAGMANNPITYSLFKISGLLKDTTGGIDFGLPMVMGNGMPITFNVADLMRTGALAGGIISSMAQIIGAGGGGGLTGKGILKAAGISNTASVVTRGNGLNLSTAGGASVSESGSYVGNANSDDVTSKTMSDQTDSSKSETASAVDESDETKLKDVDSHIINIIEILKGISDGSSVLNVKVEGAVQLAEGTFSSLGL